MQGCGVAEGNKYLRWVLHFDMRLGNRTKEGNRILA